MRFLEFIVLGALLLSNLIGRGIYHVSRSFDINSNGQPETLVLNTKSFSAAWIEIRSNTDNDTLWSYSLPQAGTFADGEIVNVNDDNYEDIVLIPDLFASVGNEEWFYIFLGNDNGFSSKPMTLRGPFLDFNTIRPSNLSLIPGGNPSLAVSFGSPARNGLLFDIEVVNDLAGIKNTRIITAPIINNGHGSVYVGGFTNNENNYVALLTPEKGKLKTAVFEIKTGFELIYSQSINIKKSKNILGSGIQSYLSKSSDREGLLIPFISDDVLLLSINDRELVVSNTSLTGKGVFPLNEVKNLSAIIDLRSDFDILKKLEVISNKIGSSAEKKTLPPPSPVLPDEAASLNSKPLTYEASITTIPDDKRESYKVLNKGKEKNNIYKELSPTLTDFLLTVKEDSPRLVEAEETLISVPSVNKDMESVNWADEAGFTQLNLGEYISEQSIDTVLESPIPDVDLEISNFTKDAVIKTDPESINQDTALIFDEHKGIDLYYVLAITPVSESKDRYVFDGQAPFGVSVNQIPSMGSATHLQHGISADFSTLNAGEVYDFAYSMRDPRLDSITTLTMVHDLQTNVVFMSISPTDDSLSQSYQPESFDPKLFEFPNYFFEGFPTSLDMDFTDKLIRFTFQEDRDSTYKGIYLSSTTPSIPSQSLAVFMDEGVLQAIRGEVVVRANRSKKVTTEFDLVGTIEPDVLFSRLIEEMFPEELKLKLLQGASLEEPLFGPSGKLPKITREPRLPKVQPSQIETLVPIEPKTSNIPDQDLDTTATKSDSSAIIPITQEDEIEPITFEVEKTMPRDSVLLDSLKLEKVKEVKSNKDKNGTPRPEESQTEEFPEENSKQEDTTPGNNDDNQ